MQLKKLSIIAASTLIVSGNIYAGAPTAYDNWVVEDGVIYSGKKDDGWLGGPDPTAPGFVPPEAVQAGTPIYTAPGSTPTDGFSCDDGNITCKVLVQDNGFIYEEITFTHPNGDQKYLRMVVVDDTVVDGDATNVSFSSESFVPFAIGGLGAFAQGLAVKQVVRDSQDNFVDVAEIQKGMLRLAPGFVPFGTNNTPTPPDDAFTTKLSQTFSTADLDSSFGYTNYTQYAVAPIERNPDLNIIIGQETSLTQTVLLGDNPGSTEPKKQAFEYRQVSGMKGTHDPSLGLGNAFDSLYHFGAQLTMDGSMTLETYPIGGGDNGYDGSTVPYSGAVFFGLNPTPGDDVRVTWIAATELANFGDVTNPAEVGFAYQQVVNKTTDTSGRERYLNFIDGPSNTTNPLTIDPFDWDENNFGTQPVF